MIFFYLCFLLTVTFTIFSQKAVVIVPIADLVGQPMRTLYPNSDVKKMYHTLPVCGGLLNPSNACPRMHQLLYNDIVDIIKIEDQEVCITIHSAFYYTQASHAPHSTYWTLKENIMPLSQLTNKHNHLPDAIDFSDKNNTGLYNPTTITLTEPYHDKKTKQTFSAGTRFTRTHNSKPKRKNIYVYAFDYKNMKEYTIRIPAHKCSQLGSNKTKEECIADFVSLIKKWAHTKNGTIPYVWGGTSYATTTQESYTEIKQKIDNNESTYYQFTHDTSNQKSGLDCTGLVIRAAHMCGIPYFCKNSSTIAHCLRALTSYDALSAGDLMVIRGHVMVISDIEKNLLIEARSYAHGYGKLQEISIDKVFAGINTYDDLITAYLKKQKLSRKDINGTIRDSFDEIKVIRIASAWK